MVERVLEADERLVERARSGDREAFGVLVGRYEKSLLAVGMGILGCQAEARDAAQETLLLAYQRLRQLRQPRWFGWWVLKIVRRQALRMKKRRRVMGDVGSVAAKEERAAGLSAEVLMLLERLSVVQKQMVLLRYVEGYSTVEIGKLTGMPVGSVTKQLSRAHGKLREWLMKEER